MYFLLFVSGCQYQCKRLPEKTRLRNDVADAAAYAARSQLCLQFLIHSTFGQLADVATVFKKAYGSVVSNRIGMKFGRVVYHVNVNTHQLTESDFCYDVTMSR